MPSVRSLFRRLPTRLSRVSRSLSLRSKLLAPMLAVVALFGLASLLFSLALYRIQGGLAEVAAGTSRAAALTQVATLLAEQVDIEKSVLLSGDLGVLTLRQYAGTARQMAAALEEVRALEGDSAMQSQVRRWSELAARHDQQHQALVAAVQRGEREAARRISAREAEPLVRGLIGEINSSLRMEQLGTERRLAQLDHDRRQAQAVLAAGFLLALAVVWALALLIRRGVVAPVAEIATVAERIAAGNLREAAPVRAADEIGRTAAAVNRMVDNLRSLISPIQATSLQLAQSSDELEDATQETGSAVEALQSAIEHITAGAQHQAASVQATVEVVDEIGAALHHVVERARAVAAVADQALARALSGGDTIGAAVRGMIEVREITLETAERIRLLARRSEQIGGFVATIRTIADQTNLLALNAAIEAARAGEHGRGFSVVADEVRKLAGQASHAAREVAEVVAGLRADSQSAVERVEHETLQVEENTALARAAGEALQEIMRATEQTAEQVHQIALRAEQVLPRADRVAELVEGVATVADENAAASEEMAAMSEQVAGLMYRVTAVSQGSGAGAPGSERSLAETAALLRSLAERFHV